jgi:mono/diheme cytochrome c family protein
MLNSKVGILASFIIVLIAVAAAFIYSGFYNIGADAPHTKLVFGALDELREKSIARHAGSVSVPSDLSDAKRISAGAALYDEMCTGCHLGPGTERTELSQGLYPSAPELARGDDLSPAQQFWVIKHGVKLTAMPAWGKTHSDDLIWDMVAFVRAMPKMSPQQYQATVASAPEDHEEMMEHPAGR